ncbi:RNA polymerase I enhancer binding protein [Coemansia sp. RSA 1933]|nr:RNA polymerase I enhancer binding protein [Coemansia sp. RSA 1933]
MSVVGNRRGSATAKTPPPMQQTLVQQSQQQHSTTQADGSDPDGQNLISLVELLQTYPGLLDDKVETVARALTHATLAATEVSSHNRGRRSMTPLQRVRMSSSIIPVLESRAAAARNTRAGQENEAAFDGDGRASSEQTAERAGNQARKGRRRWFTQQHLQHLQSKGIVFKKGKFTDEENAAIDSKIASFVETHGLNRQNMYGHLFKQKTVSDANRQLRRLFWPILAETLPMRQIQAIYHHVRRKYHPHNYLGAWTTGEDEELRRLVAAHGLAWETISQQMGRMGTNCRDRWRYLQKGTRSQQPVQQQPVQQQPVQQQQELERLGAASNNGSC